MAPLTLTYVVDGSFGAPTPNGSAGAPFPTVTAAIAALVAAGNTGGTLLIVGGEYDSEADVTLGNGNWGFIGYSPTGGYPDPVFLPRLIVDADAIAQVSLERCNFDAGVEVVGNTTVVHTFQSSGVLVDTAGAMLASCYGGPRGSHVVSGSAFGIQASNINVNGITTGVDGPACTFEHCSMSGTNTFNGTSPAAHVNNPWTFRDCEFANGAELVSGQLGGGARFDCVMDNPSMASFWRAGGVITGNIQFYKDGEVSAGVVRATAATNTAATAADTNFHAITGNAFDAGTLSNAYVMTGNQWPVTYQAAYSGTAPPPTPRQVLMVTVLATISTPNAAHVAMAVAVDDDLVGEPAPGFAGGVQEITTPAAAAVCQICVKQRVFVERATARTIQPVFACLDAEDVAIHQMQVTFESDDGGMFTDGW